VHEGAQRDAPDLAPVAAIPDAPQRREWRPLPPISEAEPSGDLDELAAPREPSHLPAPSETAEVARPRQEDQWKVPEQPLPHPAPIDSIPILSSQGHYPGTSFEHFGVNPTYDTLEQDASTFSSNVSTASYTLTRGYLQSGTLPDEAAVRVEDFVNYFDYGYRTRADEPVSLAAEAFPSPSRRGYHVLQIGLHARDAEDVDRKPLHLVFVIDRSGSMSIDDRIGLVRRSIKTLLNELGRRDTVSIVSFSNDARIDLEPTIATERERIAAALESIYPSSNTNVEAGLRLGYSLADREASEGAVNRVILLSDGVANEGITEADGIFDTVRQHASHGITVTTIGVGKSNFNDVLLNRFAELGKGNYFYIDGPEAARRIFSEKLAGTTQTLAKDTKIQVVFDPNVVSRYRLLGYESRALRRRDFNNDDVNGGEMGVGHSVTAIYEVKLLRTDAPLGRIRIRYKAPDGESSRFVEKELVSGILRPSFADASPVARLGFVAASFAEKLRGSYWARALTWSRLQSLWEEIGEPVRSRPEVTELGQLVRQAAAIDRRRDRFEDEMPLATMDFDHLPVLR
jgi:Ca-activated chloride channel family protein